MTPPTAPLRTVLFDLDGTLADTAPDLAYALNTLLQQDRRTPLAYEQIRPVVSHGANAILRLGYDVALESNEFAALRNRFLEIYRANLARATRLFPGMDDLLSYIEDADMNWGVVTNKPAFLTDPLIAALGLASRAVCVVSGDTTANRKPHPEPLLYGCGLAGSAATQCLYIGDAERDITAGREAGMATLVALFGYLGADDHPESWGADALANDPQEIISWIERQRSL